MKMIVDWPDDLTREKLTELGIGKWIGPEARDNALHRLAAIAPVAKPQEEVKRWVWMDPNSNGAVSAREDQDHPNYAKLVTFPRKPQPVKREVVLWETSDGQTRVWSNTNKPDFLNPTQWHRVGAGLVEK